MAVTFVTRAAMADPQVFASTWENYFGPGTAKVFRYTGGTTWEDISPPGGLGKAVWDMEWIDGELWVASQGSSHGGVWKWDGTTWESVCPPSTPPCSSTTSVRAVGDRVYVTDSTSGLWRWLGGTSWERVAGASGMQRSHWSNAQHARDLLFMGDAGYDEFWVHDPTGTLPCGADSCPAVTGSACPAGCYGGSCIYSFADHDEGAGMGARAFAGAYGGLLYAWDPARRHFQHAGRAGSGAINALAHWRGELYMGSTDESLYRSDGGSTAHVIRVVRLDEPLASLAVDHEGDELWVGFGGVPFSLSRGDGQSLVRSWDGATWVDRSELGAFGKGVTRLLVVPGAPAAIACDAGDAQQAPCDLEGTSVVLDGSGTSFNGIDSTGAEWTWEGDFVGGTVTGRVATATFHGSGLHEVTLTVRAAGLESECRTVVEIVDDAEPALAGVPAAATIACDDVPVPEPLVTATDACDGVLDVSFAEARVDGPCPDTYFLVRTWQATDAAGNSANARQVIAVQDVAAPVLAGVPADFTADCPDEPDPAPVTASDACDPSPLLLFGERRVPGPCPQTYELVRTWTARDRCGNAASQSQVVRMQDVTAPALAGVPADVTVDCPDEPDPAPVTASDACDPSPLLALGERRVPGPCPQAYDLVRTWTARDACGNSVSQAQVVHVQDVTAPVLVGVPADVTVDCLAVPPPAAVTATDGCDATPRVDFDERRVDGPCPGSYDLLRRWTATDACGNATRAIQVVRVRDTTPPQVERDDGDRHCLWPPNHRMVSFSQANFAPVMSDDCSGPVTWRFDGCASDQPDDARGDGRTQGDCEVAPDGLSFRVRAERDGREPAGRRYAVTIVAVDACGNASPSTVIGVVHVPHDSDPASRCR